jgi:signal transduction histidine kinase
VPDTPWLVSLEFPYNAVVQGSSRFLFWLVVLGTFVVAVGLVLAWIISKNLIRPLNQLTNAVDTLSSGEFAEVPVSRREDEVGRLARSFNEMSLNLRDARSKMEEKISEAESLNIQLRRLTAHLQNIREEERKLIAREMHDELGQLLTGFKMDIQLLKNHLPGYDKGRVGEHIQSMTGLIDDAIRFVRRLSSQLREGPLEDLGLIAAIQWYIKEFTRRYNIPVAFNCSHTELKLPPAVRTGLFRICQESLTNIARHSHATQVQIDLEVNDDELSLTITDNGKGFATGAQGNTGSLGLLGMNERALMIGATLSLRSAVGKGTMVKVAFPIGKEQEASL